MKKYLFIAASALALASCSSEDFVGTEGGNVDNGANKAINFGGKLGKITRANDHVGADAAALLNNKFIVTGFKGEKLTNGIVTNKVFDHYTVTWEKNTAGTTTDNTSDWKYVGLNPQTDLATIKGEQTIKYWDYSTGQYDYIAFSSGEATIKTGTETPTGDNEVKVTAVNPATATTAKGGAYTIQGTATALHKCYIADLITAYNPKEEGKPEYQKEVQLSFRNLTSKVRVAFYETIPGYSVKDVKFYTENTSANNKDITETKATLFTQGDAANNKFYGSGTATVYFPHVGTSNLGNSDYNKAHVAIAGSNEATIKDFGTLNYTASKDNRLTGNNYLSTTTSQPTYAGGADDYYYQIVLPNEAGTTLTLRVNYTLVANDGSGETINVYGAKAIVPAKFAEWKSNYAYTYVFKISDNTNGLTGLDKDTPAGLYPITFDAVVADSKIDNQTTITTVATPSITTYQKGHDITKDEYSAATGAIYVMVKKPGNNTTDVPTLADDLDKAKLYTVTDPNKVGISEATVHDALTIGSTTNGNTITGRNGITLTKADMVANFKTIPGIDENDITITEKTAAKFTPTEGTYAFVYKLTTGEKVETFNTAYKAVGTETVTEGGKVYYEDFECTEAKKVAVGTTLTANKIYHQKITNNNNTYAIKVIKVVK